MSPVATRESTGFTRFLKSASIARGELILSMRRTLIAGGACAIISICFPFDVCFHDCLGCYSEFEYFRIHCWRVTFSRRRAIID